MRVSPTFICAIRHNSEAKQSVDIFMCSNHESWEFYDEDGDLVDLFAPSSQIVVAPDVVNWQRKQHKIMPGFVVRLSGGCEVVQVLCSEKGADIIVDGFFRALLRKISSALLHGLVFGVLVRPIFVLTDRTNPCLALPQAEVADISDLALRYAGLTDKVSGGCLEAMAYRVREGAAFVAGALFIRVYKLIPKR